MRVFRRLAATWVAAAVLSGGLPVPAAEPPAREPQRPDEQSQESQAHAEQIAGLIKQLGDKDYFVRERAQAELAKLGFEALDALNAATLHEDLEIVARAKYLLRMMQVAWTDKNDPPDVKKLLGDYEGKDVATKLGRMRALADLPDAAGIPALCRLVRFEKSSVLSKQAAIQLFDRRPLDGLPAKELAETVRKNLGPSSRAGAKWLRIWLRFGEDSQAAIAEWTKLVEAEQAALESSSKDTSPEIVAALLRFQINWFKKLQQTDKAMAAMRRLLDVEQGDPATLAELLDWLVEQKAWKVVAELAERFDPQIKENAILLYTLAQAYSAQGDKARAEKAAEEALNLNPGKEVEQIDLHRYPTAFQLRQRGLFPWAEREFRYVIQNAPEGHDIAAAAQFGLSEMFHDQEKHEAAGKLLEDALRTHEKLQRGDNEIARRSPAEIRSRMHYFLACHFQSQKDLPKQQEHLQAALEGDDPDIDAIIAFCRLPNLAPDRRQKVREVIGKTIAELENRIRSEPNNPMNYNQYAWLAGNTEGDLDLALKYSKKSLELSPESGSYYDTLAHVYFAKGDYQNAVKTQSKAARLEPRSGQIRQALERFRAKLEEQKKAEGGRGTAEG